MLNTTARYMAEILPHFLLSVALLMLNKSIAENAHFLCWWTKWAPWIWDTDKFINFLFL